MPPPPLGVVEEPPLLQEIRMTGNIDNIVFFILVLSKINQRNFLTLTDRVLVIL